MFANLWKTCSPDQTTILRHLNSNLLIVSGHEDLDTGWPGSSQVLPRYLDRRTLF